MFLQYLCLIWIEKHDCGRAKKPNRFEEPLSYLSMVIAIKANTQKKTEMEQPIIEMYSNAFLWGSDIFSWGMESIQRINAWTKQHLERWLVLKYHD